MQVEVERATREGLLILAAFIQDKLIREKLLKLKDGILEANIDPDYCCALRLDDPDEGRPGEERLEAVGPTTQAQRDREQEALAISIAEHLRAIGDNSNEGRDLEVARIMGELRGFPTEASRGAVELFRIVFDEDEISWDRVGLLFLCTARICEKYSRRADAVTNQVMLLFRERVAPWVVQRGGWGAVRRNTLRRRWRRALTGVTAVGVAASVTFVSARMLMMYYHNFAWWNIWVQPLYRCCTCDLMLSF